MSAGVDRCRSRWRAGPPSPRRRAGGAPAAATRPARSKVLRYAFRVAETGFDPAQISDLYSRTVHAAHLRGAATATTTWRVPVQAACR